MERFGQLELDYLAKVIASGTLNSKTGKFTPELEERFAKWVGAEQAVAMNSAMSVLHASVAAVGVGPGVEVICDSVVHFGGAAVMYHNGVPVFAISTRIAGIWIRSLWRRASRSTRARLSARRCGEIPPITRGFCAWRRSTGYR